MFDYFIFTSITQNAPPLFMRSGAFVFKSRRRPTLPHSYPCSTIGPEGLNFRVRDGNGCDPLGIATEKTFRLRLWRICGVAFVTSRSTYLPVRLALCSSCALHLHPHAVPLSALQLQVRFVRRLIVWSGRGLPAPSGLIFYGQASRPISTGKLNRLLCLHTRPINVVVYNGPSGGSRPGDT